MGSLAVELLWHLSAAVILHLIFKCLASSLLGVVILLHRLVLFWSWGVRFLNLLSIFRISLLKHRSLALVVSELDVLYACSDIRRAAWHAMDAIMFLRNRNYVEIFIVPNCLLRLLMFIRNFVGLLEVIEVPFLITLLL